ncbi:MAG: GHKL domain-containing protein, partial [Bdellovibrionales bacterium]|nr:GHKL domain-containing protein [Bdellovibrionales bacterium]
LFKKLFEIPEQYQNYDRADQLRISIQKSTMITGAIFGLVFFTLSAIYNITPLVILAIIYLSLLAISLYALEKFNHPWAVAKVTFVIMSLIVLFGSLFVGAQPFFHVFILCYMGIPFVMLPHSHRKWQVFSLLFLATLYYVVEYYSIHIPGSEIITEEFKATGKIVCIAVGFIFLFNSFFYFSAESDRQQKEIAEAGMRLARSNQMNTLSGMAAGVAHEVNNPLAIISSTAQVVVQIITMGKIEEKKEQIIRYMNKIDGSVTRIAKIVHGLRILAKDERDDLLVNIDIKNLIDETLMLFREQCIEKNIEIKWRLRDVAIYITAREAMLKQVILNLIENSLDAVDSLPIRWIEFEIVNTENELLIYFTDSGYGISEKMQKRIFDPFFTSKQVKSTAGIGLSICRTIMNKHGGNLEYVNMRVHTTFLLRFPMSAVHIIDKEKYQSMDKDKAA